MSDSINELIEHHSDERPENEFAIHKVQSSKMKTTFHLVFGFISLCLGLVGLIMPILPTTPFILLASYCFMRSSKKFFVWIRYHPKFQSSFENKGLTKRGKITILIWAWCILLIGAIFTDIIWLKLLLISIGGIKTFVFAKLIRTVPITIPRLIE